MTKEEKKFEKVCLRLEKGESLRGIFASDNSPMSNTLFYKLLNRPSLNERYARAKEIYADSLFDEIIEISYHSSEDHTPFTGANVIQRDRLKVDARKWILSKLEPKKYGDKQAIEHTIVEQPLFGNDE